MKARRAPLQRPIVNWLLDAVVFTASLVAFLSGIYFLMLPRGGYQGGRNPLHGISIFFQRSTWDDLHTWGGVAMIVAAVIHMIYHWSWVKGALGSLVRRIRSAGGKMSKGAGLKLLIDVVLALSFLLTALSGSYFLLLTSQGLQSPSNHAFLLGNKTWDLIHTWAGVLLIETALIHFVVHWRWVQKVTRLIALELGHGAKRLLTGTALNSQAASATESWEG